MQQQVTHAAFAVQRSDLCLSAVRVQLCTLPKKSAGHPAAKYHLPGFERFNVELYASRGLLGVGTVSRKRDSAREIHRRLQHGELSYLFLMRLSYISYHVLTIFQPPWSIYERGTQILHLVFLKGAARYANDAAVCRNGMMIVCTERPVERCRGKQRHLSTGRS